MSDVTVAFNYSSSIANMAREMSESFSPLEQAAKEMDSVFEPVREQMRLNESITQNLRRNIIINQAFFDRITPSFETPSLAFPQLESVFSAINTSVIKEMSETFSAYNESILNEMMTRQLYVNVATAEVDDDLSEDEIAFWEWIAEKVYTHSPAFGYYFITLTFTTLTAYTIISDTSNLSLLVTLSGYIHQQQTARRNEYRDTK